MKPPQQLWEQVLTDEQAVVYALDENLNITYCNPAWDRFAAENGGQGLERERWLGRCVLEAVPKILRKFYGEEYRRVIREHVTWRHSYECSSPQERRLCEMIAYPARYIPGLVVANFTRIKEPYPKSKAGAAADYLTSDRMVVMCANCRRARRQHIVQWDWVPEFVIHPPERLSHGLCPLCVQHYILSDSPKNLENLDRFIDE